jgi:membrane protease YdiL (CAAX protease family)
MTAPLQRSDLGLAVLASAGAALFFSSLGTLWPLARTDLTVPPWALEERARSFLAARGEDLSGFAAASALDVDTEVLDYVEEAFGFDQAQRWIEDGLPIVLYHVDLKRAGDPDDRTVTLHPTGGVLGWSRRVQEDEPGARIAADEARRLARRSLTDGLRLDPSAWQETSQAIQERPKRRAHAFAFERVVSSTPELREHAVVLLAGDEVVSAARYVEVPGPAKRAARAAEAGGRALQAIGFIFAAIAATVAFSIFLLRLRAGTVELGRAGRWIAVLAITQMGALLLQSARIFEAWEPLWPRWVSTLQYVLQSAAGLSWVLVILLAFIAAGDALDRESGAGRSTSLWELARGRFGSAQVGRASLRGFLVGLLCGGVLAGSVLALQAVAGARVSIQPRGFFFYGLNAASPSLSTLLFFLNVALAEELGYRFFAGPWILSLTRRRWAAILLPALLYGLTHTRLDFLPPAEPFWGRAVVMTLVGCVWGWAFFRYDALTVVLSHYTADLFIFNWPRLGSGAATPTLVAAMTVLVPLVPAVCWGARSLLGRVRRRER